MSFDSLHDFLQEKILAILDRQRTKNRKDIPFFFEEDIVQQVLLEFLSGVTLHRELERVTKRIANRNRHSHLVEEEQYEKLGTTRRKERRRVYEKLFTDLPKSVIENLLEQEEVDHYSSNYVSTTTGMPDLMQSRTENIKKSRNFFRDYFSSLDQVLSALNILNEDLEFQILSENENYKCGAQLKGDRFVGGDSSCPICNGRNCFTIYQDHKNWISCHCFKEQTHCLENPRRSNNDTNIFSLFFRCPIRQTKSILIDELGSRWFDNN